MKQLTEEGLFDWGGLELVKGKVAAFAPVVQDGGMGLGLAVANEPGYYPVPLTFCNSDNYNELADHADVLNQEVLGLDFDTAAKVVMSSMRGR